MALRMYSIFSTLLNSALRAELKIVSNMELSKNQQRILNVVIEAALESDMRSLHGAAVVRNGTVYATGHCSARSCMDGRAVNSVHAEIAALRAFLRCRGVRYGDVGSRKLSHRTCRLVGGSCATYEYNDA